MNVIVAGDFCPLNETAKILERGHYGDVLDDVSSVIKSADYSIVNLECPIVDDSFPAITKKGPNLRAKSSILKAVKYAGFNVVTLANNHFRDFGNEGCRSTMSHLESESLSFVGGGLNITEACKPLYKDLGDKTLAIINVCEHEFSIATDDKCGSAPIDLVELYHNITTAKRLSDYLIIIAHGGHEHFNLPRMDMVKNYRWFIEIGADAVVNHHQHCYSGYEIYMGKPIFYGIGNFCFPKPNAVDLPWNKGYMVQLQLGEEITFKLIPYIQCNGDHKVKILNDENTALFYQELERINHIIDDTKLLKSSLENYYEKCGRDIAIMLGNNSDSKILRGLKRKGFLSCDMSLEKMKTLYDYFMCESHRDKVQFFLEKNIL